MKVLLAMSGGVDSSVAGALLLRDGHDVVGVTMKLWGGDSDSGCCSVSDVDDARRVAQQLDIDHLVFNFGDDFDTHVVAPYVDQHMLGITPNPCIECNRHLKFDRLLKRADQLGFDAVATGHYARIEHDGDRYHLRRGVDVNKDQSYVVHMLNQDALARTLLPIGGLAKPDVRALAAELGLRTAAKPDSQDVCFISRTAGGRETFLGSRIPLRRGRIIDEEGAELGATDAVELVTIGQRRGLGLPGGGPKRYVVDVDVAAGVVTVGDEAALDTAGVVVRDVVWTDRPTSGTVRVQSSAHGTSHEGRLELPDAHGPTGDPTGGPAGDTVHVLWSTPQRRIAPGQSVVFYDESDLEVLGGGLAV